MPSQFVFSWTFSSKLGTSARTWIHHTYTSRSKLVKNSHSTRKWSTPPTSFLLPSTEEIIFAPAISLEMVFTLVFSPEEETNCHYSTDSRLWVIGVHCISGIKFPLSKATSDMDEACNASNSSLLYFNLWSISYH